MTKPYVNNTHSVSGDAAVDTIHASSFQGATFRGSAFQSSAFQGAIVDANGREIPITEQMIQDACKALEHEARSIYTREVTGHTSVNWKNPALVNY